MWRWVERCVVCGGEWRCVWCVKVSGDVCGV